MAWKLRYNFFAHQLTVLVGLQTAVEEVHRGAEAIAENYRHSALESREQYDAMYKRSVEDPEGFWSDIAKEFYWKKQVGPCNMVTSWLHGKCHASRSSSACHVLSNLMHPGFIFVPPAHMSSGQAPCPAAAIVLLQMSEC